MSFSCFVTGTDTGIGKTVLATTLALGLGTKYWKPIQTGASEGTDSDFARSWLQSDQVCPEVYSFPDPISPHLAAARASQEIHLSKCLEAFAEISKPVVVEGAGGVLVPLNAKVLMIDLIAALNLPVILAAGTRLGTINHTLLTLEALKHRQITVAGIVTIGEEKPEVAESLASYGRSPILAHLAFCHDFSERWFRDAIAKFPLCFPTEVPCPIQ